MTDQPLTIERLEAELADIRRRLDLQAHIIDRLALEPRMKPSALATVRRLFTPKVRVILATVAFNVAAKHVPGLAEWANLDLALTVVDTLVVAALGAQHVRGRRKAVKKPG